jgi:hypothetical protein
MKTKHNFKNVPLVDIPDKGFMAREEEIKMRKKHYKKARAINNIALAVSICFLLLLAALGIAMTYWIASSDLPDWVKFLLLR